MVRMTFLGLVGIAVMASVVPRLGGAVMLGEHKEELVGAYEKAGLNVSECRARGRSLVDRGGGMPECLQGTFRDAARKLDTPDVSDVPVGEPDLE
jgi:hypothetical protein